MKQTLISFMELVTQVTVFLRFLLLKKIANSHIAFYACLYLPFIFTSYMFTGISTRLRAVKDPPWGNSENIFLIFSFY